MKKEIPHNPVQVQRRESSSESVTLRVRSDHLRAIEDIADSLGVIRSAAIQIAISEFIERRKG